MTVDANGAVISAVADKSDTSVSAGLRAQAEAVAKNIRYRPFEPDGHSVTVTLEERMMVLPPELRPKKQLPFPLIRNWDSIRITLKRTLASEPARIAESKSTATAACSTKGIRRSLSQNDSRGVGEVGSELRPAMYFLTSRRP